MKRFPTLAGAIFLIAAAAGVWRLREFNNARRATAIVQRAFAAETQLPYTALSVSHFRVGKKLVELKALVAKRPPNMRRIHYITEPLSGVTVWQDKGRTYRYEPKGKQLEIYDKSQHRPGRSVEERALVLRNYRPRLEGMDTVADRPAYRIFLAPRRPGDPSKRLWIDQQTYLKLGSEDYDSDNHVLRETHFQEIDFDALDPEGFRPPAYILSAAHRTYSDEAHSRSVAEVSEAIGFRIRLPHYVPAGYVFDGAYSIACECGCEKPAAQVRWSNGLNTISMFQCGDPCEHGGACPFTARPHPVKSQIIIDGQSFLFIGETAAENLERMARSLRPAATRPR